jgi:TniQ
MRTQPLPWEGLPSLLTRIAHRMGYEDPRWIVSPEQLSSPLRLSDLSALAKRADYDFLEQLLLLDEETLYHLTPHRFTPSLSMLEQQSRHFEADCVPRPLLSPALLRKFFLPASSTKVCPLCLSEKEPYDRLHWKCRVVSSCPEHNVLLLDRCPACAAPIASMRASLPRCPRCDRADFRTCATPSLRQAEALSRGNAFLLQVLGVERSQHGIHGIHRDEVDSPIADLRPHQYFKLFEGFRYLLNQTLPRDLLATINGEMDALPPELFALSLKTGAEHILLHTALFYKIFDHWPDAFYAFLDLFHALLRKTYGHGYYGKASHYLFFHLLAESAFEPIVRAFRVYDDVLWQRLFPPADTLKQGGGS